MPSRSTATAVAKVTAIDADSIGLKFDCGVEVTLSAARSELAAPTDVLQQVQLESAAAAKLQRERRSQKKAEVALRRERRFDQYVHLSHVGLGKDHAIYSRRAPGAKDAVKPVLKLERHSNLSEMSDLDAEMKAEAAAVAGELEEDTREDVEGKELTFEPDASGEKAGAISAAFALPPTDRLDSVFPLPPSLQPSPRFGPSAPPMAAATEALTNLQSLEAPLPAEVTDNAATDTAAKDEVATEQAAEEQAATDEEATYEAAEAKEEAAAEEAALDGWVLISPSQLPHRQGLAEGGAVVVAQSTSLLCASMWDTAA